MWVTPDNQAHTAAIPVDYVSKFMSGDVRRSAPTALDGFDLWRDGGVGDKILAAVDSGIFDTPGTELEFEAVPVPDEVLAAFSWSSVMAGGVGSAEAALERVSLRWRLDVGHVLEDLVEADMSTDQ